VKYRYYICHIASHIIPRGTNDPDVMRRALTHPNLYIVIDTQEDVCYPVVEKSFPVKEMKMEDLE